MKCTHLRFILTVLIISISILYFHLKTRVQIFFVDIRSETLFTNESILNVSITKSYTNYNKTGIIVKNLCFSKEKDKLHLICDGSANKKEIIHGFEILFSKKYRHFSSNNSMIFLVNTRIEAMTNLFHFFKDFLIEFYLLMEVLSIPIYSKKR